MQETNESSCDEDDFSDADSQSLYTSSSSTDVSDDEDITQEDKSNESEAEVSEKQEPTRPLKRARTRGGYRPWGARTRGGHSSSEQQRPNPAHIAQDGTTSTNHQIPTPAATRAEKKKLEKEQEQAAWKDEPNKVQEFLFTEKPGLKINMPSKEKFDFYKLFLTDELIDLMVLETNQYAEQEIERHRPLRRTSRFHHWTKVDAGEMKKFIGILHLMGLVRLPTIEHYWSRDVLYGFNGCSSVMSRNRFQMILRFWHFANNEEEETRLDKVMPLVDQLNNKMTEIYHPDRDLSIDESMMLWRGRLVFRQYIKNKRHKYGVKFYELCQSNGIVLRARIYSGESVPDKHDLGQTGAVVINLMDGLLQKGYRLFVDNYYNSFELARHMIKEKTYICGTLRSDRTSNPLAVTKAKLKKGEVVQRSRDGVTVAKWKDKRDVLTISNMHSVEMVPTTNKRGEKKQKPNIVRDYNAGMSGVDKADQMISYYDSLRKTVRWYKKVGLHVLDILMHNAYALNVKYGSDSDVTLLKYREFVIKSLMGLENQPKLKLATPDNIHYLMPLPPTEKKTNPTKPCLVCSREKKRKETRYFCEMCPRKPALCVGLCFKNYHLQD